MAQIFRKYSEVELFEEYQKLKQYKPNIHSFKKNKLGYKCSNNFFQYERLNTSSTNKENSIEYWNKNQDKLIHMSKKYKRDIHGILQFMNHTPSQFPPNIAISVYTTFNAQTILDPFAGWGDRCIAAMSKNLDYIGVDCNKNLKIPYKNMISYFNHNSNILFINEPIENVNLNQYNFDFVFSSPPFWDEKQYMVENYKFCSETNYTNFMDNIFIPLIKNCIVKANWTCFYMPSHMEKYINLRDIKTDRIIKYVGMGNKKYQEYSIYCYRKRSNQN